MSLLYTLQALDRSCYRPVVAVIRPSPEVIRLYADQGFETIPCPGIYTLEHTNSVWTALHRPQTWPVAIRTVGHWADSERRTLALVDSVRPDLVHLNSAVLMPSAHSLYRKGIPFVWHVREGPVYGHLGLRLTSMRRAMLRWPSELIFLSEAERFDWVKGARGRVIPNFVDFMRFDRSLNGKQIRRELGIGENAKIVLYLGGISAIKGIFPLLHAIALAKAQEPRLICLMPGSKYAPSGRWRSKLAHAVLPVLGSGTHGQRVDQTIRHLGLEQTCIRTRFTPHVERLLAACDLLVFPSITNHFARPIIEAAAMSRPVVASRFPILQELVKHGETGLLVPPGAPAPLADAILELLWEPEKSSRFGERACVIAKEKYDATMNTRAIMQIYDDLLDTRQALPASSDSQTEMHGGQR